MIDNTKSDIAEDTWRNRQITCNLEITANVGMVLVGETWNFRNLLMSIYITFTHSAIILDCYGKNEELFQKFTWQKVV